MKEKRDNRDAFENMWGKALQDAESQPSPEVWDRIERGLNRGKVHPWLIVKLMAAASLVFAMGLGTYTFFVQQNEAERVVSISTEQSTPEYFQEQINPEDALSLAEKKTDSPLVEKRSDVPGMQGNEQLRSGADAPLAVLFDGKKESEDWSVLEPVMAEPMYLATHLSPSVHPEIHARSEYFIIPDLIHKTRNEEASTIFLAGIDIGTGVFNPNTQPIAGLSTFNESYFSRMQGDVQTLDRIDMSLLNYAMADAALPREESRSGFSYSYGINVGARIKGRFVVHTGLQYVHAQSVTTTSGYFTQSESAIRTPALASNAFANFGSARFESSPAYDVDNSFNFISVPLKAGYVLLDQKLSIIAFGGLATDFFLNNRISSDKPGVASASNGPGSLSPYRSTYFNGLISASLNYKIGENYALMIEPQYRRALNSFTKSDHLFSSDPHFFILNFGLMYNFR
ncbi:MAG: hypothetical protein JJU28_20175 [Cyclobacteriaceae bacterium]|nr:hypothetical protein [Cyclobacteriaceae bacterium]